ncbi:MAG: 3-dehydroquinate synthase [Candidatus Dormibacteria bacterium]
MRTLVLTGMMGTGKSTVGPLVARRLGLEFVDGDVEIERRAGRSVSDIVAADGETALRVLECAVVADLLAADARVLALGGGALLDDTSRSLAEARAGIVSLTCALPELLGRLEGSDRPLLAGGSRRDRVEAVLAERAGLYARYPGVDTSGRSPEGVADHVAALHRATSMAPVAEGSNPGAFTTAGSTGLHFGSATAGVVAAVREATGGREPTSVVLFADASLPTALVAPLREALVAGGLPVVEVPIAGGEPAKRLDTAAALYGRLLAAGVDRGAVVVGVGGGVITDLSGFVASTYLRGLPLVLVPTTLLAQVDAAVGGKTAVDLVQAKNVVGTLHPAHAVLVDAALLSSLPERELRNGLAEMVKLGLILDAHLLDELETLDGASAILGRPDLVERSARGKLAVVARDPHDRGVRMLLNFGHTVGHAVETVSGYAVPHGEAVSQGMVVATRLALDLGLCSVGLLERLVDLLGRVGLPIDLGDTDVELLVQAMAHDKKRLGSAQRFVLPTVAGAGVVHTVPAAAVHAALLAARGVRR